MSHCFHFASSRRAFYTFLYVFLIEKKWNLKWFSSLITRQHTKERMNIFLFKAPTDLGSNKQHRKTRAFAMDETLEWHIGLDFILCSPHWLCVIFLLNKKQKKNIAKRKKRDLCACEIKSSFFFPLFVVRHRQQHCFSSRFAELKKRRENKAA